MAGKHIGAGEASTLGANYIPGSRIDKAYAEGRRENLNGDQLSGTDNTSNEAATMTDSTASFPTAGIGLDGRTIRNVTGGGSAVITANTGTVVTGILTGSAKWDAGPPQDAYHISGGLIASNPHVAGTDEAIAWAAGFNEGGLTGSQYETDKAS